MINRIVESLDQKPDMTNSIIVSLAYTITLITVFCLSALLIDSFIVNISRTIYTKYIFKNYIWLGIALFIAVLSWNFFRDIRNRYKETSKSSTSKCLTLICYFISCNVVFIAATFKVIDLTDAVYKLLWMALLFFIPAFMFFIYSSYILIKCSKELIESSKIFDIFVAVVSSSLDSLLFMVVMYFLLGFLQAFPLNFAWHIMPFFAMRLSWKIYKIYNKKAES